MQVYKVGYISHQLEVVVALSKGEYLGSLLDFLLWLGGGDNGLFPWLARGLWDIIVLLFLFGGGWLLLRLGCLLVFLEFFQVGSYEFEELFLQVDQLLLLLLYFLIVDGVVLLDRLLQIDLALGHLQVLLPAELALEDLLHDYLLIGLEGLVVEGLAQTHH